MIVRIALSALAALTAAFVASQINEDNDSISSNWQPSSSDGDNSSYSSYDYDDSAGWD